MAASPQADAVIGINENSATHDIEINKARPLGREENLKIQDICYPLKMKV